ncbi:PIF1 [Mytilus coruscus]|uniref:ATP-dependent DNA helicase n=1 Tax=Mytilus coruscus TaxID=42192 RepID=A0A6J8CNV3_MYTCO|nr:PIF1 [Mytilus coruscus]
MDEDQKLAFELATSGHNLVISGQAGTGKTFLVKKLVYYMRFKQGKNVSIVCSTGIAATHYGDLRAQTLHKWSGVEDGRHLNEEIIHFVKTDERFTVAKHNIETVETLIIDESSMISAKIFNQVQVLCKNTRNSTDLFGNIQVILVGDFFQLPPVSNELYGDPGKHYDSVAFLKSLDWPLQNERLNKCVHLFARNYDVDVFNYNKIQSLQGDLKVYASQDEGSQHYLSKFLAPKNLGLKLGCPVMLIKNLNDILVNGLCGTVTKLSADSVEVKFTLEHKTLTVTIAKEVFTTFDPVEKIVLAKRVQLPLKVGFAITIHKAQGMTIENLVVDCNNSIQPGQLGVAIGRAVSIQGLRVINFRKSLCRKHPVNVFNFYDSFSLGNIRNDLTCCRKLNVETSDNESKHDDDDNDNDDGGGDDSDSTVIFDRLEVDSDFSESEIDNLEFIENILGTDQELLPDKSGSRLALDTVLKTFTDTPVEANILVFSDAISKHYQHFYDWFQAQRSIMEDIGLNCFPEGEVKFSQKHRNDYFIKFNKHINSKEYEDSVITLLNYYGQKINGPQFQLLTSIMFYLEKDFFFNLSTHLHLAAPEPLKKLTVDQEMDFSGKGKLRYISGYVLAKLKYTLSKKIRNSLYVKGKETDLARYQFEMDIFNSLTCSYDELNMSTTEGDTLLETKRKQNDRESLTNVSDVTFNFFQKLEIVCREKFTHSRLVDTGKYLFSSVKEEVLRNYDLFENWIKCVVSSRNQPIEDQNEDISNILSTMVMACENYIEIFQSVITLFLKVNLSQFRRDYLTFLKKEKGVALRKKVMQKSQKATKSFNMKFFSEDNSTNKEVSFLRLKSELMQSEKFFNDNSFTKKELVSLCIYCFD